MSINRFQHTIPQVLISLILFLALSYQLVNKVVYTHTHVLYDGSIIIHAHPYTKSDLPGPISNHTHTRNEILLLSLVSLLFFSFSILLYLLFRRDVVGVVRIKAFQLSSFKIAGLSNKSPPVVLSI